MTKAALYITLEPERGKPVTLARVSDRALLTDAATVAISEAEKLADEMSDQDQVLGELQRHEVQRLRRALEMVVPEIRGVAPLM